MDTRGTSSVSPQAKAAASLATTERSRQGKHGEGDSSKHHLDDIELAREDMGRRHSFKLVYEPSITESLILIFNVASANTLPGESWMKLTQCCPQSR